MGMYSLDWSAIEIQKQNPKRKRKEKKPTNILRNPPLPLPLPHAVPHQHKTRHGQILKAGPGRALPRPQARLDDAFPVGADEALGEGDVDDGVVVVVVVVLCGGRVGGAQGNVACGGGGRVTCEPPGPESDLGGVDADDADGVAAGVDVEVVPESAGVADEGDEAVWVEGGRCVVVVGGGGGGGGGVGIAIGRVGGECGRIIPAGAGRGRTRTRTRTQELQRVILQHERDGG